mmetsp:Transcript_2315/g.5518  ORF Transcript_2315/g.5518 Transcript_2315/m.5518 type:complete len:93 (+) Transcript_2315:56-334(+)
MQNDKGEVVDTYIPRKCNATNRVIAASDHASVQLNIGHVDVNGVYTGEFTPLAFSGFVRKKGLSDQALNRLAAEKGLMKSLDQFPAEHKYRS